MSVSLSNLFWCCFNITQTTFVLQYIFVTPINDQIEVLPHSKSPFWYDPILLC